MPVRYEDDRQRRPIESWESWIETAICEAEDRGEFDDLPDRGKPIRLEDQPFDPDTASAFRTLKNAGYEPTWMELDREITRGKREMEAFLDRSAAWIREQRRLLSEVVTTDPHPQAPSPESRWVRFRRWLLHGEGPAQVNEPTRMTIDDLHRIRARMREQYLERAAAVDKKVTEFHAALPRQLWHLERMRITPDAAARAFDEAVSAL